MRTDHGDHCNECHPELHRAQCSIGGCVAGAEFQPCGDAPIGIVTNCAAMRCETNGCAMTAPQDVVSLDDLRVKPNQNNVCGVCRNYWDTPGHFYGCPVAADELARLTEEMGLYE